VQALWDGEGRRVRDLPRLSALWRQSRGGNVSSRTLRLGTDARQFLGITVGDQLHVFGPDA